MPKNSLFCRPVIILYCISGSNNHCSQHHFCIQGSHLYITILLSTRCKIILHTYSIIPGILSNLTCLYNMTFLHQKLLHISCHSLADKRKDVNKNGKDSSSTDVPPEPTQHSIGVHGSCNRTSVLLPTWCRERRTVSIIYAGAYTRFIVETGRTAGSPAPSPPP